MCGRQDWSAPFGKGATAYFSQDIVHQYMRSMMSPVIWCVCSQNKLLLALPLTLLPLSFAVVIGLDFSPDSFCAHVTNVPQALLQVFCCTCYKHRENGMLWWKLYTPPTHTHTHTLCVLIMGFMHRSWAPYTLSCGPNHTLGPIECLHITKPSSLPECVCWSLFQHLTTIHTSRWLSWAWECNM